MQRAQRRGDVFGLMMIDRADKTQRQVKLVVILPARRRNTVHRGAEQDADGVRRPQRDEQAVGRHGAASIAVGGRATTETCPMSGFA